MEGSAALGGMDDLSGLFQPKQFSDYSQAHKLLLEFLEKYKLPSYPEFNCMAAVK